VQFTELTDRNAATLYELGALREAVNDIETGGRGFALTADDSYLEPFDSGRLRFRSYSSPYAIECAMSRASSGLSKS
jgi:CHASE3 domain sensor protein